jgi:hypothetical protein
MMTTEQLNTILERLISRNRNKKSGTRKVRALSPIQSDTEDVHTFGPTTKVQTTKYSDDDSNYLGPNANRPLLFHYDESSPKRKKHVTRPLKSWDRYMVLIPTVSYVYCYTRERLRQSYLAMQFGE